jgi:hypothetical protein
VAVPALCLLRYARADELKIKELTLQLEKVTNAMTERRAEVEMEVRHTLHSINIYNNIYVYIVPLIQFHSMST